VTATDVANSAFTVTKYVVGQVIDGGSPYNLNVPTSSIESYAINVGMRYYLVGHLTDNVISVSPSGYFPPQTFYDVILSGEVQDFSGHTITTFECNSNVKGYVINENGTIEAVY
jgi:hypothetical protein